MKLLRHIILGMAMISVQMINAKVVDITSPNGNYLFSVSDEGGVLRYHLQWQGEDVIKSSQLGIKANTDWQSGLSIQDAVSKSYHQSWHPVYGERSTVKDDYVEWKLIIKKKQVAKELNLIVRAYDEGIAFQYHFASSEYIYISDEYTQFVAPEGTMAYVASYAQSNYRLLPLKNWDCEAERPLLLREPNGVYVCLGEAKMTDYCRTKFKLKEGEENTIRTSMYGVVEDIAPYSTPWRVIMCAKRAGDILENNDIFQNLNDPCKIKDPSWIRPGKVMREVTLSTTGAKSLVDFAVKHHLQYIHFDAGWYGAEDDRSSDATTVTLDPRRNPDPHALDLMEAIKYAKSKGVGVFLYVNMRALEQQLDDILPLYKQWGVSGIKFGFVEIGSQTWTRWLHEAVKKCAKYGLMVDIHDEYRPTGFSRTYPNLLTQEGIRGNEEFPDATTNTILPFTRFVSGAADYTICYYQQDYARLNGERSTTPSHLRLLKTTPAHQLALSMIYYSPLQFLYWYDKPSDCHDEPELKFFDDLYTTWDDTKVLEGAPGQYISMARRHGKEWFVGAITNNDSREITISLDFLDGNKPYLAEIYTDGGKAVKTRTHVLVEKKKINKKSKLRFKLPASGGVAIHLQPLN